LSNASILIATKRGRGILNRIIELLIDKKIFIKQRKNHETKVIAHLVYHAGLCYQKTSTNIRNLEPFSYEALRKWYKKCIAFFQPKRKLRQAIAVDETKVKWKGRQIYIWIAIDIEDHIVLVVYVSVSRTSFDVLYLNDDDHCEKNIKYVLVNR
jgi:transposase-like protein